MRIENIIILGIVFALLSSCGGNKMKADEQSLSKQILTEEQQLAQKAAERAEREKQLADSIAKLPRGFQFKEIRNIDPEHPPVVIDFTKEIPIKKFYLSEIANNIRYLKLSIPDDSMYFSQGADINFTNDNIIVNNNFGIYNFDRSANLVETIARSNISFKNLSEWEVGGFDTYVFDKENYKGVWRNHVSVAGDRIFYKKTDYPNEKVSLLNYEIKTGDQQLLPPKTTEISNDGSLFKGEESASSKEGIYSGTPGLSSTQILGISPNFYAGVNSHLNASGSGVMLATFNLEGDTLCKFTQFDKLENPVTSSLIRSISSVISWNYKGAFSFVKSFNDTIFRLIPPNRLVPAYVFNFGSHKVTDEDWYQTNNGIKEKYLITSIQENEKYIFLGYQYFNKNGERESYNAIFNKSTRELTQLPNMEMGVDPTNSIAPKPPVKSSTIIENDIDYGLPFWPQFITPHGELGILVSPEHLKDYLKNTRVDTANEKRIKLQQVAKTLKSNMNERIIMLVK